MKLTEYLRSQRNYIVKTRELLAESWSPTYGPGQPSTETVEVVDFDALMNAIDEFSEKFK